ncbi:MAG: ribonuclease H-like domain-containing protein [Planctomycetes bacterium]|nr:ribonuclease H-like domain-containing protein [Planctomycetota bacterium]
MPSNVIAFDIEVAGFAWEEVDEITRGYLVNRERDEEKRAAVPERTALYPGLGKVIAIGMWLVGDELDRGMILLEGAHHEEKVWEKVPSSKIFRGSEEQLLARFWELVGPSKRGLPRLVTFNGRGYDGPMLTIRSAQLGLKPSRSLMGNRYSIAEHCDLSDIFSFQGATRERYSLDYWCRRFDVESPKGSIDGSQVGRAYREGRIEDIGEYCLRDVRATAQLYQKLENTMIPLFQRS